MADIISDAMWMAIRHLFSSSGVGRPLQDPRAKLNGILFILRAGCSWRLLPRSYGAKSTVHRAFMLWSTSGIFEQIHEIARICYLSKYEPSYFAIDAALGRARHGGKGLGKNPCDRGKMGIKKHLIVDLKGTPLFAKVSSASTHDVKVGYRLAQELITHKHYSQAIPILAADAGYDASKLKKMLTKSTIVPFIAINKRRSQISEKRNSKQRWVVESAHSWLNNFRSLLVRFTKYEHTFQSFLSFACSYLVFGRL